VLGAIALLTDFGMFPVAGAVLEGPPTLASAWAFVCFGCTLAQGSLLAAWLVLFEGPFSRRLVRHWGLACALWLVWFVGVILAERSNEVMEVGFTVAFITPLVSLGAQIPLWMARHFLGWRLSPANFAAPAPGDTHLSIRDLMVATVVVAVAFGLARLSPAALQEPEFWAPLLIGVAVAAIAATIAILPAAAMLLRPRPFHSGLTYAGLYALLWVSVIWIFVGILRLYGLPLPPYQILICLCVLILTYAGTCCLAAYVAREQGYYLTWRTRPKFS
jgi:hypothetical protein